MNWKKLFKKIIYNKNNPLENKKFGVIVSLFSIIFYFIIKCLKYDNINHSTKIFTKTLLEMSLLFTFIVILLIFINLFLIAIFGMKEDLYKNLNKEELFDIQISLGFALLFCLIIIPIITISFLNIIGLNTLQGLTIIFAIVAYLLDKGFHTSKKLIDFDIVIIVSLVITFILSIALQRFSYFTFVHKDDFVYGFTAGATAFEVFFAGLFFNTEEYSKERIFKLKEK